MKTAVQIAQEIKKHKPIDKTNVMYDETWENWIRGRRMTIEEYLEIRRKEIDTMTLKQARDIIASSLSHDDMQCEFEKAVKMLLDCADKTLEQEPVLDKIRAEIEQEIEQVKIARKVFRYEKIDAVKAEECSGSITAYHNVIAFIDQVMKQGRK